MTSMSFQERGKLLKQELEKKKEAEVETMVKAKSELVAVNQNGLTSVDQNVLNFFKRNNQRGLQNVSTASLPYLKVIESNSSVELPDGTRPKVGSFYYEGEILQTVDVHFVNISRGFYSPGLDKTDKPKFNQIASGVFADTYKPFVMFFTGKRLSPMWDFMRGEVGKHTKGEFAVPLYALRIKLTTEKVKNDVGTDTHIINFELLKHKEDQSLVVVDDLDVLQMLDAQVEKAEEFMNGFINNKAVNKDGSPIKTEVKEVIEGKSFVEEMDSIQQGDLEDAVF
jgi:hypothetical protein